MNLDRFEEFKRDAELQCKSSEWLCEKVAELLQECKHFQDNYDTYSESRLTQLENELTHLENRCIWEDKLHEKLIKEYEDIL